MIILTYLICQHCQPASGSAARMRANSDGDDEDDEEDEDGIVRRPRNGRRDLEPMNLTFDTP